MFGKTIAATVLAVAISVSASFAGDQYVDKTGFAASGYDVVSYFDLKQSAVGQPQSSPLAGKKSLTAEYNGATFAFASKANLDRFQANPAGFAPQYDGHCAYGVAKGGKVPGNPTLWRIVDGKLYLNINKNVVGFWEEDIPGNLKQSKANWKSLDAKPASTDKIPSFKSAAPVAN